jgi:AbrB family looped-hinge helix DNA binding protein
MQSTATIKGQIVIPAELRKKYGIKAGTKIQIMDENERIVLQPITREYIHSLRGKFRGKGLLKALAAEKKQEKER